MKPARTEETKSPLLRSLLDYLALRAEKQELRSNG
jgi:hypothetical protein